MVHALELGPRDLGAVRSVVSVVPLSLTPTALSEMSHDPVIWAFGALTWSHFLKSLRWAESWARYDFVVTLVKSTFLPGPGFVFV